MPISISEPVTPTKSTGEPRQESAIAALPIWRTTPTDPTLSMKQPMCMTSTLVVPRVAPERPQVNAARNRAIVLIAHITAVAIEDQRIARSQLFLLAFLGLLPMLGFAMTAGWSGRLRRFRFPVMRHAAVEIGA